MSPHHRITASDFPHHSSDWLIVPTTANQITGIGKPNYDKTLIFFPTTSLKWSHEARIDELADSNEPATNTSENAPIPVNRQTPLKTIPFLGVGKNPQIMSHESQSTSQGYRTSLLYTKMDRSHCILVDLIAMGPLFPHSHTEN